MIYCINCKYIDDSACNKTYSLCYSPNNFKEEIINTWYKEVKNEIFLNTPANINKNNNCKWFEEKEKEIINDKK